MPFISFQLSLFPVNIDSGDNFTFFTRNDTLLSEDKCVHMYLFRFLSECIALDLVIVITDSRVLKIC